MLPVKSGDSDFVDISAVEHGLQNLVGLTAFGVLVGPCGFHVDFGVHRQDSAGNKYGDYSLFIQCPFRITGNRITWLHSNHAVEADSEKLRMFLTQKAVARVGVDLANRSLRLLLASDILLTAVPQTLGLSKSEVWSFYDHTNEPASGFVVSDTNVALVRCCGPN